MNKLEVKKITAKIGDNEILKQVSFTVKKGETVLILGPNGHGKSTLFKTLLKHYSVEIVSGEILIDDFCVNELATNQIAEKGMYLAVQHPIEIPGLKTFDLLRNELKAKNESTNVLNLYKNLNEKLKKLNLTNEILERNINENFSGGERKKVEILQMQLINPDFILLDEIDSGLDIDALNKIVEILKEEKANQKAIIYISHNERLPKELQPDRVLLMVNGTIVYEGDYSLAEKIHREGYEWVEKELQISLNQQDKDVDLMKTTKSFYCNEK